MATWIHCNKCFVQPSSSFPRFFLTNCGHILCKRCLEYSRQLCEKARKPLHCYFCSKGPVKAIPIDSALPKAAKIFFMDTHKLWMEKVHQLMKTYSFQLEQCKQLARTAQRQQIQSMALGKKHKELIEAHKKSQKESDLLKTSVQFYKGEIENRGEEIGRLKQEIFELKNNRYLPASAAIPSSYSSAYAGNLSSDVQSHIPTFHGTRMTPSLETANTSVCDITISGTVSNTSMLSNASTAYSNRSKDGSFRLRMDDTMNQREEHSGSNASMSTLFMLGLNSSSKRTSLDTSQSSSSSRLSFSRIKKRPYYAPVVKPIW